ncbi:MAG TPA: LacI family DNA-binding transcriptional regulator, partial [Mobilitalea sp.]|nr:LacI family DNA-binding transcriptional regulator [Mobilitalea sp.]
MVSIKDISFKCGVSVATVSKALNNHSDIAETTKQNIRKMAKEMGYFPNSSARALKTNRTYNLGVLFVDEAQSGLTHEYFANVLDSFKVEAEKNGYDITFINKNMRQKSMSYYEHSKYRGVDGVVIA